MNPDLSPRNSSALAALLAKGVRMALPLSVEIGEEVDVARISGDDVVLHPGTRIRGASTVISPGCELGREAPVTVEDCHLGRGVRLAGGYAARATFLDGSSLGLGHHVREGTLLEEQASAAHCVGLKQTILLPFVTLGSLINFCDCLMAGGTSRRDHSEVGSAYIHFNFTPGGDKTTPSLFGDVPRGVLLREKAIFLGGQGGAVGPVQVAYGATVGAGSILRSDVVQENSLTVVGPPPSMTESDYSGREYRGLNRLVAKNVHYVANLDALTAWYAAVRTPFFAAQGPFGVWVGQGAVAAIESGRRERLSRLRTLAGRMDPAIPAQAQFAGAVEALVFVFGPADPGAAGLTPPAALTEAMRRAAGEGTAYLDAVRDLPDAVAQAAVAWLSGIIASRWSAVAEILPAVARIGSRFGG